MYTEHTLKSGIKVYFSKLPIYRSASIGFWFKTGSINEKENDNGISHFIEHMLFKGTPTRSAKDIAEFFDTLGGDLNAFTSKECTCYHARVLDKHLEMAIEVMADMVSNPLFAEEEIVKEKGVIIDEILMAEDTPDDVSYDLMAKTIFGEGSLGLPILGTMESVDRLTRQMLVDYFTSHYTNGNMVISIAGSFNEISVLEKLNACLNLSNGPIQDSTHHNIFHQGMDFIYRDIEQVHLEIGYEGYSYSSDKIFDLAALNAILGSSVSSRLFQTIRETHGLTYSINSYLTQYETMGIFNIYASMHKDNLIQVIQLIKEIAEDIIKNGFTDEEIANVKEQLKGNYILDLEGSESHMNLIGKGKLFNKPIYTVDEIENKIDAINRMNVEAIANDILAKKPSISLVGRVDENILNTCIEIL